MGSRFAAALAIVAFGLAFSTPAEARCACSCVDGLLNTLCTLPGELEANPDYCATSTLQCSVPDLPPVDEETTEVEPPVDGAVNCREAVIEGIGTHKVCEIVAKRDERRSHWEERRAHWAEKEAEWAAQESRWAQRARTLAQRNPAKLRELQAKWADKRAHRDERRAQWAEREARWAAREDRWADRLGET